MSVDPKVTAATLGAAVAVLFVGFLSRVGVELSDAEQGAVTTVLVFLGGYFKSP